MLPCLVVDVVVVILYELCCNLICTCGGNLFVLDIKTAMALNYEFFAAIRGFHVYRQAWEPEQDETLVCSHEADNPFDLFSIKATNRHGVLSAHLPREISRPTKYPVDRGASVTATLTDVKYRRSPLFQGVLEIPCQVKVEMPSTVLASKALPRNGCEAVY